MTCLTPVSFTWYCHRFRFGIQLALPMRIQKCQFMLTVGQYL